MERKIVKIGNSHGILLTKDIMEEAGIEKGDIVDLDVRNDTIIIWKGKKPEEEKRLLMLDKYVWNRFEEICEENGDDSKDLLQEFISDYIGKHESFFRKPVVRIG